MKILLKKDIGLIKSGEYEWITWTNTIALKSEDGALRCGTEVFEALMQQGYIEEIQEPKWTDKQRDEFALDYAKWLQNHGALHGSFENLLEQFKKEYGK